MSIWDYATDLEARGRDAGVPEGKRQILTELGADSPRDTGWKPPLASELTEWEMSDDQISYSAAVEMDLAVASIGAEFKRRVLIREWKRFQSVERSGQICEYGVSLRMVVTVYGASLEGTLTLPMVSAQAQLNLLNASAKLRVIGYRDPSTEGAFGNLFPNFQDFDVENYGNYTAAMDALKKYISSNEAGIEPTLLRKRADVTGDWANQQAESVGVARALMMIAKRRSRDEALENTDKFPAIADHVTQTYDSMLPDLAPGARPPEGDPVRLARTLWSWFD